MKFFYILILFLMACGRQEPQFVATSPTNTLEIEINKDSIDAAAIPYLMEFLGNCEKFKISDLCKNNFVKMTSIRMVPNFNEPYIVGMCYIANDSRWIELKEGFFDTDGATFRGLVFHELAHCLLGNPFPHYEDKEDIMSPFLLSEKIFQSSWPALIKALFSRAGGTINLNEDQYSTISHKTIILPNGTTSCKEE